VTIKRLKKGIALTLMMRKNNPRYDK